MDNHTPRYSAHAEVPRIVGPNNPKVEYHSEWTTEGQDQNEGMQMDTYPSCSNIVKACAVGQARDPRLVELSLQAAPPQPETPTFAEKVSLDTFGMGAHSVEQLGPYFEEGGPSVVQTSHSTHYNVGGCDKNRCHHSHQQCPVSENQIDPRLMEPGVSLEILQAIGQYGASPVADTVIPTRDDFVGFVATRNMRGLPQQLGPAPLSLNNPVGHIKTTFPHRPLTPMFEDFFSDMPWAPPATIEPFPRRPSHAQYSAFADGTSTSNLGYGCSSSSAFGPTMSSDTSFHSNFVPPSGYAMMQPEPGNSSQTMRAGRAAGKHQNHLRVGWRPRGPQHPKPYSRLNTTSSVSGIAAARERNEAVAVIRSFSDCISAPGDVVQMDEALSPTPSEASTSPSVAPDVLICQSEGCQAQFTGRYRRGNLLRHIRLIHNEVKYPCGMHGCEKTFNRQDARLKHYRKHHANDLPFLKPPSARKYRKEYEFSGET